MHFYQNVLSVFPAWRAKFSLAYLQVMKQIHLVIFTLILLSTGCQKEFTPINAPIAVIPIIPTVNDSTLLRLYIRLDTLHAPGFDTANKYEFRYDNLKRLTYFAYTDYDTVTGLPYGIYKVSFSYNASDTLPATSMAHLLFGDYPCSYKYDLQGRPIYKKEVGRILYDPFAPVVDSVVSQIQYTSTSQITQQLNYRNGSMLYIDTTIEPAFNASNTINNFSYINNEIIPGIGHSRGIFQYNYLMHFDTYKNPLQKVAILFKLFPLSFQEYGTSFLGGNDNYMKFASLYTTNITSSNMTLIVNGVLDYTDNSTITYTYNAKGYPVSAKFNMNEFGSQRSYSGKKLYFYTN